MSVFLFCKFGISFSLASKTKFSSIRLICLLLNYCPGSKAPNYSMLIFNKWWRVAWSAKILTSSLSLAIKMANVSWLNSTEITFPKLDALRLDALPSHRLIPLKMRRVRSVWSLFIKCVITGIHSNIQTNRQLYLNWQMCRTTMVSQRQSQTHTCIHPVVVTCVCMHWTQKLTGWFILLANDAVNNYHSQFNSLNSDCQ